MRASDHVDATPRAGSWRCPHCGTLQSETARCWRCARAALACATCHHFRTSVAAELGYCALDPARTPLSGEEIRDCWQAVSPPPPAAGLFDDDGTPRVRERVPLPRRAPAALRPPVKGARPPLQEVRAAAWAEVRHDRLVEAPPVEPGPVELSEVRRRSLWRWRR